MQLLLRQPASALLEDGMTAEVAASPDSPGRERWQWDVRLEHAPLDTSDALSAHLVGAGVGDHYVNVRFDPEVISADLSRLRVPAHDVLERDERELWVAIVENGRMFEGIFDVTPGDVAIWEGDDPVRIPVGSRGDDDAEIVLVRIWRRDGRSLRWVP